MSPNIPSEDSQSEAAPVSSGDLLPPIEPPSAGFIIQLFVVPAVIVAAVVLLWVTINWLASPGRQDADAILSGLRSAGPARFQRAQELSSMLRMERSYPELKNNRELADGLAQLLTQHVAAANEQGQDDAEDAIRMRMFLCGSLGEFHVEEPLGALLKAAEADPNGDVRRSAIGAIAVLADWLAGQDPPRTFTHPELVEVFTRIADSADALDRSAAAFTLGVLANAPEADPALTNLLAELADDFYFDARYNAAVGLARIGDLRAVPVLVEMLDFEQHAASVASEQAVNPKLNGPEPPEGVVATMRNFKRDTVVKNALVGVQLLRDRHDAEALPELGRALKKLINDAESAGDDAPIAESLLEAARQVASRF